MEKDCLLISQLVTPPIYDFTRCVYDERTRFDTVGITYIPVNSAMSFIM